MRAGEFGAARFASSARGDGRVAAGTCPSRGGAPWGGATHMQRCKFKAGAGAHLQGVGHVGQGAGNDKQRHQRVGKLSADTGEGRRRGGMSVWWGYVEDARLWW